MIEGLDLEDRRKNEDLKLSYLLSWPACFSGRLAWWVGNVCWVGGWDNGMSLKFRREICVIYWN